ncbi:MAG: NAD(P)/FAD-dependent oxidoreductase [Cyclobacteriaceae bacterium]|nr:NAD(P)/FAD-dependent oxidoreductase [Cyclobacteriaceae bacterium]
MSKKYDAIIIGGGHNGLICAAYLAKAGRKVLVLEKRHVLGGAAVSEEVYPGFTFSVASYVVSLFRPHIIRELELAKHGYEVIPMDCSFLPLPDGNSLARWADGQRSRREIARFSKKDSEVYPEFSRVMTHMGKLAKAVIDHPAPDITSYNPKEIANLLRLGNAFKDLGPDLFHLNTKLVTMSALDFLDQWFESDVLKAPMSVSGIIGTFQGVRSPGTAYVLLHHYMGQLDGVFRSWGFSKGGTGGVSMACARAAMAFGAEVRTEAPVKNVIIKNGTATGVVLDNGDEISANVVISNLDPNRTYLKMIGENNLDPDVLKEIKRFKLRGSSGKVNLALDSVPEFSCRPGDGEHIRGDIAIAPGIDYLERAFDQAKYGEFSTRPYINAVIPTLTDPTLAPPGKHIMSCFVQYAPYHIKEGAENWPKYREAFGDTVVDTLAEYIPGLKDKILFRQVLSPWDIEQSMGLTEGNIFHGELSLEQLLFQRPMADFSKYKTSIPKLWMCGSGTHPGGGIMGASGELCAKTMLTSRAL